MNLVDLKRGIVFEACGYAGEKYNVVDVRTGSVTRIATVEGYGTSYSFNFDDSVSFDSFPVAGTALRVRGRLKRKKNMKSAKAVVESYVYEGQPNFSEFSIDDLLLGCKFDGIGFVERKDVTEFQGKTYYKLHIGVLGDCILFEEFGEGVFDKLPDNGFIQFQGQTEFSVKRSFGGNVDNEIRLVLEKFLPVDLRSPMGVTGVADKLAGVKEPIKKPA
jgi:hypothetical protein